MRKRSRAVMLLQLLPLVTLVASASCTSVTAPRVGVSPAAARNSSPPPSPCPSECPSDCPTDCGVKLEHGPWVYSGVQPVIGVCIQAGREHFGFTQDGSNECYTVTGLGTPNVSVTRKSGSRCCKDICSVVFYFDCGGGGSPG